MRAVLRPAHRVAKCLRGYFPRRGGRGPGGPPATLRLTLGEYKAVNGVQLPHLITRGANDMTIEEWTIDSYRVNPAFRADVFTK